MFRSLFRRNRTIRVPIENSGHDVRQVRFFKSPLSKPSNFISTFIIAYFAFRFLESYAVPREKDKGKASWEKWKKDQGFPTDPQQDQQLSEHWKKAHEAMKNANPAPDSTVDIGARTDGLPPDVITTIALPVWIRPKKGAMFQPDDPESKDFARIQSDQKKITELKKHVADWALVQLQSPHRKPMLNHIGFTHQVTVVLDLVPQLRPPPLYEVPALMLFKDGIGIGWKTLRPDLGTRMDSMMRPGATYEATKASLRIFFRTTYAITRARIFGGRPPAPPHVCEHCAHKKEPNKDKEASPLSQWPASQTIQDLVKTVHDGQATTERHKELVKNLPLSTAISRAAATFRQVQAHQLMHSQQDKARGTIYVRGAIICMGERGKYRMDVVAFYLPSEDRFVGHPIIKDHFLVKDYSKVQKLEDEKKKKLMDAKHDRQMSQAAAKSPADEHEHTADKSAPGKEKE